MALQKFLVDFDLNGNQIKNAVLGTVAGTTPGAFWFDSSTKEVKFVNENGSVKAVAPTSVTDALASDIADVAADLASEITRATGAEAGLASDIAEVAGDLAYETSARESADSALDSRLDTVEGQIAALDSTYATDAALSSAVSAIPNCGKGIFNSVKSSENLPLSSAKSKASKLVPMIFIPCLDSFSASFKAV